MIPHSFREAQKLYNLSVNLANTWISKYYRSNSRQILGVPFEKIQAFSQHHFFSSLLQENGVDDVWNQYPNPSLKSKSSNLLKRLSFELVNIIKEVFSPAKKIAG